MRSSNLDATSNKQTYWDLLAADAIDKEGTRVLASFGIQITLSIRIGVIVSDHSSQFEVDRRTFIQLLSLSAASAMTPMPAFATIESAHAPEHAALHELSPTAVQPNGWLRLYLEKQAAELGSNLPKVSWPFTAPYWKGEEEAPRKWWPWEQVAYWIDGATRLALVLRNDSLLNQTQGIMQYTLDHADDDGYLGPSKLKTLDDGYGRWPHTVFFRGLAALADGKNIPEIAPAIQKHFLADKMSYGAPPRNVTNVENILWCYGKTGDPQLLTLAEKAWEKYSQNAAGAEHCDLSPDRVYFDTSINAHGVDYIEAAKQPAILYMHTGKPEYLKFALAAQRRIFDHHMLIDGVPSTSEWYRTTTALDSHETCDIADHSWSWGYMLMATGDGIWGDRIERACFNGGFGAIKKDWKALQYFSSPNQVLATLGSDHNFPGLKSCGGGMMAYQPNPGQATACCAGNVHRLFPNYTLRMWMKEAHGGLAAALYGPSTIRANVGLDSHEVEVIEETDYPFSEEIRFRIRTRGPVEFSLFLRMPAWCPAPAIKINADLIAALKIVNGFAEVRRTYRDGDAITLTLPMKTTVTRWPQGGIGIERGPLVYSLPIKENWSSVVRPRFSTEQFPCWEATPASAWNYGMALASTDLDSLVKFTQSAMTTDPWVDPPLSLTVPMRMIEDWTLYTSQEKPALQFTPPLPGPGRGTISDRVEAVRLVPYGATHLRLTIFPELLPTSRTTKRNQKG